LITPTVELEKWMLTQVDAPSAHLDTPGFVQAFDVQPTVAPPANGQPPQDNSQVQNQPTDTTPKATPNGQPKTGNIPKPVNAP
jgi:hypothetical protein